MDALDWIIRRISLSDIVREINKKILSIKSLEIGIPEQGCKWQNELEINYLETELRANPVLLTRP